MTRGFGDSPALNSSQRALVAKETVSSPDMEGPIALVAPELPEDTLMDVSEKKGIEALLRKQLDVTASKNVSFLFNYLTIFPYPS